MNKLLPGRSSLPAQFGTLFFVLLLSCLPEASTKITATWKDPEAGTYKNIFVAVLTKNLKARTILETDISSKLKSSA